MQQFYSKSSFFSFFEWIRALTWSQRHILAFWVWVFWGEGLSFRMILLKIFYDIDTENIFMETPGQINSHKSKYINEGISLPLHESLPRIPCYQEMQCRKLNIVEPTCVNFSVLFMFLYHGSGTYVLSAAKRLSSWTLIAKTLHIEKHWSLCNQVVLHPMRNIM